MNLVADCPCGGTFRLMPCKPDRGEFYVSRTNIYRCDRCGETCSPMKLTLREEKP